MSNSEGEFSPMVSSVGSSYSALSSSPYLVQMGWGNHYIIDQSLRHWPIIDQSLRHQPINDQSLILIFVTKQSFWTSLNHYVINQSFIDFTFFWSWTLFLNSQVTSFINHLSIIDQSFTNRYIIDQSLRHWSITRTRDVVIIYVIEKQNLLGAKT